MSVSIARGGTRTFRRALACLGVGCSIGLLLAGCGDEAERRDQNYGTDLGAGYHLPDGGADADAGGSETGEGGAGGRQDAQDTQDVPGAVNDHDGAAAAGDAAATG